MKITPQCVAALSWTLSDTLGEELDVLEEPVEFLIGGKDLLAVVERALQSLVAGDKIQLQIEPEEGFGEFDENLIFLQPRLSFPPDIEAGMVIDPVVLPPECAAALPQGKFFTITEIYPEHVVLDGNHPLAGIALRLDATVEWVRAARADEIASGSLGVGFFTLEPSALLDGDDVDGKSDGAGKFLH